MPEPASKPRTEPMDQKTIDMLSRCIAEMLLIVTKIEDGRRASNVVPVRKGSNHGR